ncbi:MAG: hypothetical protein ACUZ9M_08390 [Candidatus Scalindua sp.]
MSEHHREKHHHHHHKKIRIKKTLLYLLPTIIICAGIAALINSGTTNFLTATGNIILYAILIVFFPLIVILYLCSLFAGWIFDVFSFLYALFSRRKR